MDQDKIGKFIKHLREENNLTQEELGEKLNISGKSVSKWERGLHTPDLANLKFLADLFNVSINELLSGEINPDNKNSNDNYVKGIKFYNKKIKLKYLVYLIVVIVSFVVILLGAIYIYNDYNKNEVYVIESLDKNYYVNGYYIKNQGFNLFVVNNIIYDENEKGSIDESVLNEISVTILKNNKEKYISYTKKINEKLYYSDILNIVSISKINYKDKKENYVHLKMDDDIKIKIEYKENEQLISKYIKIKLKKIHSNDKLMY